MAVVTCTGILLSIVLPACSADIGLVNVMKNLFSLDGKTTFSGSSSKAYFACIHKIHFLIKAPVPFLFEISPPSLLFHWHNQGRLPPFGNYLHFALKHPSNQGLTDCWNILQLEVLKVILPLKTTYSLTRPPDRTENVCTVSTFRCLIQSLRKVFQGLVWDNMKYLQCTSFPSCHSNCRY